MTYLFLIIKILIIVSAVAWASYVPGEITLEWQNYIIKFSLRTYIGFTLTIIVLLLTLYDAYKDLYNRIKLRLERKSHLKLVKFHEKLMLGFIDLEMHNTQAVDQELKFLEMRHPENILGLFFQYRVAVLREDIKMQEALIARLQSNALLKPLGVKLQVRRAVLINDFTLAFNLTQDALNLFPSAWFYKSAIFLCIHNKAYQQALNYLREGSHAYHFDRDYENYLFSMIWFQYAKFEGVHSDNYLPFLQKSHEYNLAYTQPSLYLARAYAERDQRDRASQVLLETWDAQKESFSIIEAYADLGRDSIEKAQYAKELVEKDPSSPLAHLVLIMKYIEAKLWAEAHRVFDEFMLKHHDSFKVEVEYLTAILSHDEMGETERAYEVLHNILRESLRRKWTCKYCGHQSEVWQPLCDSCGKFDHLNHVQVTQNPLLLPFMP